MTVVSSLPSFRMKIPRVSFDAIEFSDMLLQTTQVSNEWSCQFLTQFPRQKINMTPTTLISPIELELIRAENDGKKRAFFKWVIGLEILGSVAPPRAHTLTLHLVWGGL